MFLRSPQAGHIGPLLFIRLLVALPPIPPVFAHAGLAIKIQTDAPMRVRPCLKAIYRKAASPYFFPSRSSYSASVFACTFSAMALLASVAAVCLACVVSAAEGVHHVLPKIRLICFICFICPRHMMFYSKTIRCPSGECRDNRHRNRFLPFRPCPSAAESPRPQRSSPFLKPCCKTAPRPRRFSECR